MNGFLAAAALIFAVGAPAALAAEVTSVQAPKRVPAGAKAKLVASIKDVASCRLTATGATMAASTSGMDQVTFSFTVSRRAKPGRHTLTLRCAGAKPKTIRLTVTARKGKRGTSTKLVNGKIRIAVRRARCGPRVRRRSAGDLTGASRRRDRLPDWWHKIDFAKLSALLGKHA